VVRGAEGGGRRARSRLTQRGIDDLEWRLSNHLLPHFARKLGNPRLSEITVADVDRYRLEKVKAGRLGPVSINKTLATLSAILEQAAEYGHVERNVAKGKRRRLKQGKPQRTLLDRADHIAALLEAAGELDGEARQCRGQRRAMLATLVFAGLRIGEALALRWGDVNLGRGTITVRESKTDAGVRTVNIVPALRDELSGYRARLADVDPSGFVFATSKGAPQQESNIRRRLLARAVEIANGRLAAAGEDPIAVRLTPHSMRRTFASLLFAIGEDAPYVMAQMGHTTPHLTLEVYARAMQRRDGEKGRLAALVNGEQWALIGHSAVPQPVARDVERAA
jgi:integrase